MLKISKFRILALATSLTLSSASIAQNRLQRVNDSIYRTEFKKADINPQDYYISQEELNEYMQKDYMSISDFDRNNDKKLNIDEFKSIANNNISDCKKKTQQSKNEILTNNINNINKEKAILLSDGMIATIIGVNLLLLGILFILHQLCKEPTIKKNLSCDKSFSKWSG